MTLFSKKQTTPKSWRQPINPNLVDRSVSVQTNLKSPVSTQSTFNSPSGSSMNNSVVNKFEESKTMSGTNNSNVKEALIDKKSLLPLTNTLPTTPTSANALAKEDQKSRLSLQTGEDPFFTAPEYWKYIVGRRHRTKAYAFMFFYFVISIVFTFLAAWVITHQQPERMFNWWTWFENGAIGNLSEDLGFVAIMFILWIWVEYEKLHFSFWTALYFTLTTIFLVFPIGFAYNLPFYVALRTLRQFRVYVPIGQELSNEELHRFSIKSLLPLVLNIGVFMVIVIAANRAGQPPLCTTCLSEGQLLPWLKLKLQY